MADKLTARFVADFAPFTKAVEEAQITLRGLEEDGGKVEKSLNRMVDNFSGRKVIQDANLMVAAIEAIGGVSQLTEKELAQVGAKAAEAAEKMHALGMDVPEKLQRVADAGTQTNSMFGTMATNVATTAASYFTAQVALDLMKKAFDFATDSAKAFFDMVLEGSDVADVAGNFEQLATSAGLAGDALMGALREGTHNTIADFELMKVASTALAAGVNLTESEFRTLASGAFALAQTGAMDVTQALQLMTNAMITGKDKGMELRFGKIDLKKAEEDYALSLGTTTENLDEEQKTQAARGAILAAVGDQIERLGEQQDGLDEKVAQAEAAWANFRAELGSSIAQSAAIGAGLDALGATIVDAFGGSKQELIATITRMTEDFAIAVIDAGKYGVEAAGYITREWLEMKLVFSGTVQAMDLVLLGLKEVALAATEAYEKLTPGTSGQEDMKRLAADIDMITQRMVARADQMDKDKALHAEVNTLTADWNTRLTEVQRTMAAARDTQAAATAATTAGATAVRDHTSATAANTNEGRLNEAQRKAIAVAEEKASKQYQSMIDLYTALGEAQRPVNERTAEYNEDLVALVGSMTAAGFSAEQLAKAYGLTVTTVKEMIDIDKAHRESIEITAALALDFSTRAIQQSGTRTDAEIADIDRWATAYTDKLQAAGTYTDVIGTQIEAIRKQKIIGVTTDWDVLDKASKKTFDEQAVRARTTYEQMLAHSENYTYKELDKQEQIALKAEDAAARWSQSMDTAADDVIKAGDRAADGHAAAAKRASVSWSEAMALVAGGQGTMSGSVGGLTNHSDEQRQRIQTAVDNHVAWGIPLDAHGQPDWAALGFRAGGGPVSAGSPYVVGERGPELFLPTQSGTVLPNGSSGGVTQNIIFNVNGTGADVARVVSDELTRLMRVGRKWPAV